MTTPRSIAASRRPGDEDLAHDDRGDHPRGRDALARRASRAPRARAPCRRSGRGASRAPTSGSSGARASRRTGRSPSRRRRPRSPSRRDSGKSQAKRTTTTGTASARATVSWSGEGHRSGRIRGAMAPSQGSRRQPRRDRDPRLPHAARARHRLGRRLLGGRPRARCTSRVADEAYPHRARPRRRRATCAATRSSRRRCAPGRRRSIPATASSPRTRRSRAPSRTPGSSGSGRRRPRSS